MKILLLTDIPPCKNFTAGLVLDKLCRFLPRDSIACFAMVNPALKPEISPELNYIPFGFTTKRDESSFRLSMVRTVREVRAGEVVSRPPIALAALYPFFLVAQKLGLFMVARRLGLMRILRPVLWPIFRVAVFPFSWFQEKLRRVVIVPRLANQVVDFGRSQNVDVVWAVLQGQTITQIAPDVARRLNARLITQVWDPLEWWLLANQIDRFNARSALKDFDRALRESEACMTASWPMAQAYTSRYGTRSVAVVSSHPREMARTPALDRFPRGTVEIGIAGQFYAGNEWSKLLRALNMSKWRVRGRDVSLTVLGAGEPPGEAPPGKVRWLGWRSQDESAQILSELDILYCPYPFGEDMSEVAKLSFPSKVVLYLAAGRPILFHGPDSSSPAAYIRENNAGIVVRNLEASAIYNGLCLMVDNPDLYREFGRNAQALFQKDFTLSTMRERFELALGKKFEDEPATSTAEPRAPVFFPDVTSFMSELRLNARKP